MARYDKYDPISGGFRAQLAADFVPGSSNVNFGKIYAVGLNSSGLVVLGVGTTGYIGLMILTSMRYAGDVVDIMTHGEITDINLVTPFDNFAAAAVAGLTYYADVAGGVGGLTATATANKKVGYTVEAKRLIVRMGGSGLAA